MAGRARPAFTALCLLLASTAATSAAPDPAQVQARKIESLWKLHWFKFAKHCAQYDGQYYICALYDPRFPSSRAVTPDMLTGEMTRVVKMQTDSNVTREVRIVPDREDVTAMANSLPSLRIGQYGYIHSAHIDSIEGPDSMTVSDIWLVDQDELKREQDQLVKGVGTTQQRGVIDTRSFNNLGQTSTNENSKNSSRSTNLAREAKEQIERRYTLRKQLIKLQDSEEFSPKLVIKGVPTSALGAGSRWSDPRAKDGFAIAVVGKEEITSKSGRGKSVSRLMAVRAEIFRTPMTEKQFDELLARAGLTREQVIEEYTTQLKNFPPTETERAEGRVLEMLAAKLGEAQKPEPPAEPEKPEKTERRSSVRQASGEKSHTPDKAPDEPAMKKNEGKEAEAAPAAGGEKKLSYKEKRELERQKRRSGNKGNEPAPAGEAPASPAETPSP